MDPGRACAFLDVPQQPHAGDDGRHDAQQQDGVVQSGTGH
jgi:hypothetical protein